MELIGAMICNNIEEFGHQWCLLGIIFVKIQENMVTNRLFW